MMVIKLKRLSLSRNLYVACVAIFMYVAALPYQDTLGQSLDSLDKKSFVDRVKDCAGEISDSLLNSVQMYFEQVKIEKQAGQPWPDPYEFINLVADPDKVKKGLSIYSLCVEPILREDQAGSQNKRVQLRGRVTVPNIKTGTLLVFSGSEIVSSSYGITASSGVNGRDAPPGTPGATGVQGGNGGNGENGGRGGDGADATELSIEADTLIGHLKIINNGGNGGKGGDGGKGGNGGSGGSGDSGVSGLFDCRSGPGNGANGGNAGSGGDGGMGGNGGNGGKVRVKIGRVLPGSLIEIVSRGGNPGSSGFAGAPGNPGQGGPRGSAPGLCSGGGRNSGQEGALGNKGRDLGAGQVGKDGLIEVTIGWQTTNCTGECRY